MLDRRKTTTTTAAALVVAAAVLTGCPRPTVDRLTLGSGGTTVVNDNGVVPVIVMTPGAAFDATVRVRNFGDQPVRAVAFWTILASDGTALDLPNGDADPDPARVRLGTAALAAFDGDDDDPGDEATWSFSHAFEAGREHDAYAVRVCTHAEGTADLRCRDVQVNLTTPPRPFTAETMTFDDVRSCVLYGKLGSIEELLPFLPAGYRSEYALMHGSLSRQAATFTQPRVIMTGPTARLIVAFNSGDPDTPRDRSPLSDPGAAKELEVIQFREATRSFEFRSVDFGAGRLVRFSRPNPPLCLGCHGGADPRPNWEPFPYWPGAYGSSGDSDGRIAIGEFIGAPPIAQDPAVYCLPGSHDGSPVCDGYQARMAAESDGQAAFAAAAATHPRYRHLAQLGTRFPPTGGTDNVNNILTTHLSRLNQERIARRLAASADPGQHPATYQHAKFLIALLLSECLESDTIAREAYLPPRFVNVVPEGYQLGTRCHPELPFFQCTYDGPLGTLGYRTGGAPGDFAGNWAMSFFGDNRSLAVPSFSNEPKAMMLHWLVAGDPDLAPYFDLRSACTNPPGNRASEHLRHCTATVKPGGCESTCRKLAAASYAALAAWPDPPAF